METENTSMSRQGWARFWAIDIHVHTPGSSDARDEDFGSAEDIVQAAIAAGLDAIVVTDHNAAAWCTRVSDAAAPTDLVVLPGFELSTPQGHLLGVWEEGTPSSLLEDTLIKVGIERAQFGALDVVTKKTMVESAREIETAGGLAIAAHIDKERGILTQPVQTHVNELLREPSISAFEFVLADTPTKVANKLAGTRSPALVQGSDTYDATLSRHSVSAIGLRRTWIKAARPDLVGLRYALDDPELRVTLVDPADNDPHPTIDSVSISNGFLGGTSIDLSPDLNSLLGGTGAGKSLVLEAIRFALEQQVDGDVFATIRDEVDSRLAKALGDGTEVAVEVTATGHKYRVRRTFSSRGSTPVVEQDVDGDWVQIERSPAELVSIAAFSQGEILEYARQPVGRVGLVDVHLDLAELESDMRAADEALRLNTTKLIAARTRVSDLNVKAAKAKDLEDRERDLSGLFDEKMVKEQGLWTSERGALTSLSEQLDAIEWERPDVPDALKAKITPTHDAHFTSIDLARSAYIKAVDEAEKSLATALGDYASTVEDAQKEIDADFKVFKTKLDATLEKSGKKSLPALRQELESVQTELGAAKQAAEDLAKIAKPDFEKLETKRESLLSDLKRARDERRAIRRTRVRDLNKKTAGFVKIDIPNKGDASDFRAALDTLKVGSRVREGALDLIAQNIRPYTFARALWTGDFAQLGNLPDGVESADMSRLHTNIADRDLWELLLNVQHLDTPDTLSVKFRKPEGGDYVNIEDLSHGQKCTAILVILLADGESPVLIDQPEDALHAPWIEDYLVDRLRQLRGTRQYLFATRSSGLVVSADAEQLVTMHATAVRGEVEASGSLERHDLNKLALHHLEGGRVPFDRRSRKLRSSITD